MSDEKIRVAKDTQVFIKDMADLPPEKQRRTVELLDAAADLEKRRGWRLMWERTPRPYLLFLAYFVFIGGVGSSGYFAVSHIPEASRMLFSEILAGVILLLALPVSFLSIYYIIKIKPKEKEEESDSLGEQTKR